MQVATKLHIFLSCANGRSLIWICCTSKKVGNYLCRRQPLVEMYSSECRDFNFSDLSDALFDGKRKRLADKNACFSSLLCLLSQLQELRHVLLAAWVETVVDLVRFVPGNRPSGHPRERLNEVHEVLAPRMVLTSGLSPER